MNNKVIVIVLLVTLSCCTLQGNSWLLKKWAKWGWWSGCKKSSDCAANMFCDNKICKDPCIDFCGKYAMCVVKDHMPVCMCVPPYTGDPLSACIPPGGDDTQKTSALITEEQNDGTFEEQENMNDYESDEIELNNEEPNDDESSYDDINN